MNTTKPNIQDCANNQNPIIGQEQAIANFLQFRQHLASSYDPLSQWLQAGIDAYINQPNESRNFKSLDHFLGLSSHEPGQRSAAAIIKLRLRNGFLKAAAAHLQQQQDLSDWQSCGVLSEKIRRFRSTRFKRLHQGGRAADVVEGYLFEAFLIDNNTPTTKSYLYDILIKNNESVYSFKPKVD